ncbi:MAG: recombinase family protein [Actinomycetota bacterium]
MARLAAIYTRISLDNAGTQSSTARQERLCRDWVTERGWETVEVFEDVAKSAFAKGVVRDDFENLLVAVTQRRIDVVVCWRLDRLARSPGEFERFWSACQNAGVDIASATEPVDCTTPVGVALVRMLVTLAGLESDVRAIRLRARNREQAEQGLPPQGRVPYGFTAGCAGIVESEATLIREAAGRVLDGEGTVGIARVWAERGVVNRDGRPWSSDGIRRVLKGRAICGDRTYRGEVAAEGCWPAIIDPLMGAEVRARLVRRHGALPAGVTDHLLRGLLRCGICGEKLLPRVRYGAVAFGCIDQAGNGCQRVSIRPERTEDWVVTSVLARIGARHSRNNRVRWRRIDAGAAVRSLDNHTSALSELNRCYFVRGELTHVEWIRARDSLILECLQQVARAAPQRRPRGLPPHIPIWRAGDVWSELSITARREVLAAELAWVIVNPSPVGAGVWCSDRLVLVWVQSDPIEDAPPRPMRAHKNRQWESSSGEDPMLPRVAPTAEALREQGGPFTISDACTVTGMSVSAVGEARRAGRLDAEFIRGQWCYHLDALDQWRLNGRPPRATKRPTPELLVDEAHAARWLNVSPRVLQRLIAQGLLVASTSRPDGHQFSQVQLARCQERRADLSTQRARERVSPAVGSDPEPDRETPGG